MKSVVASERPDLYVGLITFFESRKVKSPVLLPQIYFCVIFGALVSTPHVWLRNYYSNLLSEEEDARYHSRQSYSR